MDRIPDIIWKETEEYKKTREEAEQIRGERRRRHGRRMIFLAAAALVFVGSFAAALIRASQADALVEETLSKLEWEVPLSADFQEDIFRGKGEVYGLKTVKQTVKGAAFYEQSRTLYGVETAGGDAVIPAEYDEIQGYSEERYFLVRKDAADDKEVWKYLDWSGGPLTQGEYLYAQAFSGDYAVAQKEEGLWVVIGRNGEELLEVACQYMNCVSPERGWFAVRKNCDKVLSGGIVTVQEERSGVVDITGTEVVPFDYESIRDGGEGMLIAVECNAPYSIYLNEELQNPMGRTFNDAQPFSEGLACVQEWTEDGGMDPKRTFIDREGRPVFSLTCEEAGVFSDGMALIVREDKQTFCVDRQGRTMLEDCGKARGEQVRLMGFSFYIYELQEFKEGLLAYQDKNGLYGYMDASGRTVVAPIFDTAGDFRNGAAEVSLSGKTGLLKNPLLNPV